MTSTSSKAFIYMVITLLLTLARPSSGAVLESSAHGFKVEIKHVTQTSPESVYAQFLRINEWWDSDHSWFGKSDYFSLDPIAGGCFCEINGSHQVEHMRVVFVNPNQEIRMTGALGPLQMMAVNGAMSWRFTELNNGATEIIHTYTVTGYIKAGFEQIANAVNTVQKGQVMRLINAVESQ